MTRAKFVQRKILLRTQEQVKRAVAALRNAPLDELKPLEFLLREEVKTRKLDQNALLWVGPLKDISEQVWVGQRQYSEEIWHQHLKELFLPEEYDAELCRREDYRKWDFGPDGSRILVGSTTDLTIKGFAQHLDQVHAFGGQHGVEFHEPPPRGHKA